MAKGDKYIALTAYLKKSGKYKVLNWKMEIKEVERDDNPQINEKYRVSENMHKNN